MSCETTKAAAVILVVALTCASQRNRASYTSRNQVVLYANCEGSSCGFYCINGDAKNRLAIFKRYLKKALCFKPHIAFSYSVSYLYLERHVDVLWCVRLRSLEVLTCAVLFLRSWKV